MSELARRPVGVVALLGLAGALVAAAAGASTSRAPEEADKCSNSVEPSSSSSSSTSDAANLLRPADCLPEEELQKHLPPPLIQGLFYTLYVVEFVLGVTGNAITVHLVRRKLAQTHSPLDLFVVNLSVNDLVLCVFSVSITPVYALLYGYWPLSLIWCKLFAFMQSACVYSSTFTMTMIARLRYRLVVHPLAGQTSFRRALMQQVASWALSMSITTFYAWHITLEPANCATPFCSEKWAWSDGRLYFSLTTLLLQLIIPFCTMCYYYICVRATLSKQNSLRDQSDIRMLLGVKPRAASLSLAALPQVSSSANEAASAARCDSWVSLAEGGGGSGAGGGAVTRLSRCCLGGGRRPSSRRARVSLTNPAGQPLSSSASELQVSRRLAESSLCGPRPRPAGCALDELLALRMRRMQERQRRHRATNRKMVYIVSAFFASWLPLDVFNIIQDCCSSHIRLPPHAFTSAHAIACSSVCYNPILYAWMSENYREELRLVLPHWAMRLYDRLAARLGVGAD